MLSPTANLPEPYREQEHAIRKELVDATFDRFKNIVLAARPALKDDQASQDIVFTGRIFTAKEAQQQHLIDEIGFVEDAINRAVELAGLTDKTARVIKYHKPLSVIEQLAGGQQDSSSSRSRSGLGCFRGQRPGGTAGTVHPQGVLLVHDVPRRAAQ